MTYAVLALLLSLAGSVATAAWFRHKAKDLAGELSVSRNANGKLIDERDAALAQLDEALAANRSNMARSEAVIRGKDLEYARIQKDLMNALVNNPAAAGEYVRSQLSLSTAESTVTATPSYVPDPDSTEGGSGKRGGST